MLKINPKALIKYTEFVTLSGLPEETYSTMKITSTTNTTINPLSWSPVSHTVPSALHEDINKLEKWCSDNTDGDFMIMYSGVVPSMLVHYKQIPSRYTYNDEMFPLSHITEDVSIVVGFEQASDKTKFLLEWA